MYPWYFKNCTLLCIDIFTYYTIFFTLLYNLSSASLKIKLLITQGTTQIYYGHCNMPGCKYTDTELILEKKDMHTPSPPFLCSTVFQRKVIVHNKDTIPWFSVWCYIVLNRGKKTLKILKCNSGFSL